MLSLVHVGHNYWHAIIATSFSQDNSSEFSPIMPEEFGEHLTRDQRPFLHTESLQILQIHSSMLVLLLFSSPHSFSTGFRSETGAEAWFCAQWPIFVLFLRFVFGLLSGWKIQTRPNIRFLTESVTYWFFYLLVFDRINDAMCLNQCPGPPAEI